MTRVARIVERPVHPSSIVRTFYVQMARQGPDGVARVEQTVVAYTPTAAHNAAALWAWHGQLPVASLN